MLASEFPPEVMERAEALQAVLDDVIAHLGREHFSKGHDVEFVLDGGPPSLRYDGIVYAHRDGQLVAIRERGGRIESAKVMQGGFGPWTPSAPLAPALN